MELNVRGNKKFQVKKYCCTFENDETIFCFFDFHCKMLISPNDKPTIIRSARMNSQIVCKVNGHLILKLILMNSVDLSTVHTASIVLNLLELLYFFYHLFLNAFYSALQSVIKLLCLVLVAHKTGPSLPPFWIICPIIHDNVCTYFWLVLVNESKSFLIRSICAVHHQSMYISCLMLNLLCRSANFCVWNMSFSSFCWFYLDIFRFH